MPAGVMLGSSRLTIMKPLHRGMIIMMHSKQPQEVMGYSMIEYMVTFSTAPWEAWLHKVVDVVKDAVSTRQWPAPWGSAGWGRWG